MFVLFISACSCSKVYEVTLEQPEIIVVGDVNLTKVKANTKLTIKVILPEGKNIDYFIVDGSKKELDSNLEYQLTVTGNHKINVFFKNIEKYTLTLSEEIEVISPTGLNLETVSEDTEIKVKVIVPEGKEILNFKVNGIEKSLNENNEFTFVIKGDTVLTATFEDSIYTLTLPEKVTATPSENYTYNMAVTLKVDLDLALEEIEEFKVNEEVIDLDLTTLEYTFNITENTVVSLTTRTAKHTVRFLDYDGSVLKTEEVLAGNDATAPANPELYKHEFVEWDGVYTNVTASLDIKAKYTVDTSYIIIEATPLSIGITNEAKSDLDFKVLIIPNSIGGIDPNTEFTFITDSFAMDNSNVEKIYLPSNFSFRNYVGSVMVGSKIKEIHISPESTNYKSVDGIVYNKDMTKLLAYPPYKEGTTYEIPETVTELSVASLSNNKYIENLIIPETITKIGWGCFQDSSFKSLTFPKDISNIDTLVRHVGLTNLESIVVDDRNPDYATLDGVLYTKTYSRIIYYPQGKPDLEFTVHNATTIVRIDTNDFLERITLSSATIEFDVKAKMLKEVNAPANNAKYKSNDGMLYFKDNNKLAYLPYNKEIITITIDDGEEAAVSFGNKHLETLRLTDAISTIPDSAHQMPKLREIIVSNVHPRLATIDGILYDKQLRNLLCYPMGKTNEIYQFPATVEFIDVDIKNDFVKEVIINSVFNGITLAHMNQVFPNIERCNALDNNDNYTSVDGVLYSKNKSILKYYPRGKTAKIFEVPNYVTTIENSAFNHHPYIERVVLSNNIDFISRYAFYNCHALTKIVVPEMVTTIKRYAFYNCSNLVLYIKINESTKPPTWEDEFYMYISEVVWGYTGS